MSCALQEWGLLEDSEKRNWDVAVAALRTRLDPWNKQVTAQDFRHTLQEDKEMVADFIRRLERTFRVAYGSDHLPAATRETLLYIQLRDGLRPSLMQSPAVSGSSSYRELSIAARTEEQRKVELKRRGQYRRQEQDTDHRKKQKDSWWPCQTNLPLHQLV